MIFYWVRDRVNQNQFMIYWRLGANNVGDYVSKHHSPAYHLTMRPNFFVNLVCQNPSSYTENCLLILSLYLQRGGDNPTVNSSLVRYDSYCSHKPHGTSKPPFSSTKGYLPSITSISKIQSILQQLTHNFTNDNLTNGKTIVISPQWIRIPKEI